MDAIGAAAAAAASSTASNASSAVPINVLRLDTTSSVNSTFRRRRANSAAAAFIWQDTLRYCNILSSGGSRTSSSSPVEKEDSSGINTDELEVSLEESKKVEDTSGQSLPLYSYKWIWHDQGNISGVSNLVQSFLQLAREIDTGELSAVHFEPPTKLFSQDCLNSSSSIRSTSTQSSTISSSRLLSGSNNIATNNTTGQGGPLSPQPTLRMIVASNKEFEAILFYDHPVEAPEDMDSICSDFLNTVLTQFTEFYHSRITTTLAKDSGQMPFKEFDKILMSLAVETNQAHVAKSP